MRRGIRSFCHSVGSTSTALQLAGCGAGEGTDVAYDAASFLTVPSSAAAGSCAGTVEYGSESAAAAVTLEQMILRLDLEEEAARRAAREAEEEEVEQQRVRGRSQPRRMSCVNSSDRVLRSARDALSQYPRFSLDGRDAMCRASFSSYHDGMGLAGAGAGGRQDEGHRRASVCCAAEGYEMDMERMPATVAGESVVWCKPGVVAKLMGLEAVPVPVRGGRRGGGRRKAIGPPATAAAGIGAGGRKRRLRMVGVEELEKERLFMALHGYDVAGAGTCHAGALRARVGLNVSGAFPR